MHRRTRRWTSPIALVAMLALIAGATIASASVLERRSAPRATRVVKGCVNKTTRAVRIIKPTKSCLSSERTVRWSKTGVAGASGATGATGATGSAGGPSGVATSSVIERMVGSRLTRLEGG